MESAKRIAALTQDPLDTHSIIRRTKKARWSRQKKAEARTAKEASVVHRRRRNSKTEPSFAERLLICARRASFTKSIGKGDCSSPSVDILTSCGEPKECTACETAEGPSSQICVLHVQPLIVLDLNGIMCHRVRFDHESTLSIDDYRDIRGRVAQTPVVPRPDLEKFLRYLDRHFCLAVWTSAKTKTAKKLVNILFPEDLKSRLLFCWAQGRCRGHKTETGITFEKDLAKVWKAYPLWDSKNTLLVDDSPNKCVQVECGLHPPPLHGRQKAAMGTQTDEENVALQLNFFQKLVSFWTETSDPNRYESFLKIHARGHMGWEMR